MKQQRDLQKSEKNIRQNVFLGILIAFTGLILSLRLFMANNLVDQSVELSKLNRQIDLLETENNTLTQQNRDLTSFAAISNRAQALGFSRTEHYSYISNSETVASSLISPVN